MGGGIKAAACAVGLAGLLAAAWAAFRSRPDEQDPAQRSPPPQESGGGVPAPSERVRSPEEIFALPPAEAIDVDAEAFKGTHAFRDRLRDFLKQANSLSPQERRIQSENLNREIDRLEGEGVVLDQQALLLRLALLRATAVNPDAFQRAAMQMVDAAAEQVHQRRQAAEQVLLESNAEYRRREAAVVQDILRSEEFSDEPARQAALRKRLQALRIELYERDLRRGQPPH